MSTGSFFHFHDCISLSDKHGGRRVAYIQFWSKVCETNYALLQNKSVVTEANAWLLDDTK